MRDEVKKTNYLRPAAVMVVLVLGAALVIGQFSQFDLVFKAFRGDSIGVAPISFQVMLVAMIIGAFGGVWMVITRRLSGHSPLAFILDKASSRRYLSEILGDLQDEVYVYEADSLNMIYANKAACLRCEWDPEDLSDKYIMDSSKIFNQRAFLAYVKPLLTGEKDVCLVEAKHEKGPVEITTRLSNSPDGRRVFLSVLRDRSEQQRFEDAKTESFSEICHELRTPLTSINGALRLLKSGVVGNLAKESEAVVGIMGRNTDRLLAIVNDILDLEKMAAGKLTCAMEPVDLCDFVTDAVVANKGYGTEHDVGLVIGALPEKAQVSANSGRFMQVMENLISNGIKHSPKGESVRVEVQDKGPNWRVVVSDQGPGVPKEAENKIFDGFSQAAARDGKKRDGTGLGLTIASKIVKMHKGKIGYINSDPRGADFYVDLPKQAFTREGDMTDAVIAAV